MNAPEILATRTVHQYRRRDILTYVGLRQYLRNRAAQNDVWSEDVAVTLVYERRGGIYHRVHTFKEIAENGDVTFRNLFMPLPYEALAESALLAACAAAGGPFAPHPAVFSYQLSSSGERAGIFRPYFGGFRVRHSAISQACRRDHAAVVIHTDVRRFYPSISKQLAIASWHEACAAANLPARWRKLGEKLLSDHEKMGVEGALLTGPMFSHMIANLVFRSIDDAMTAEAPDGYFRYVDDVAIVAPLPRARELEHRLEQRLGALGFELNPQKRLEVLSAAWLTCAADYEDRPGPAWKIFVGKMKRLLVFYPETRITLQGLFDQHGIRIRPLDYSEVLQERSYLKRLGVFVRRRWFRKKMRATGAIDVLTEGLALRESYAAEMHELIRDFNQRKGFERKRGLSRLRVLTSRLVYLAPKNDLGAIADALETIPEFGMTAEIFRSLASGDVTPLLRFGPTAAQAAAQPLRGISDPLICIPAEWNEISLEAYAIFRLNGITFDQVSPGIPDVPIIRFCEWNEGAGLLWTDPDPYFRELGCVHGHARPDLNSWALETAFDRDDDLVFDMQDLMQGSS